MVTKLKVTFREANLCSALAKIHMVTKRTMYPFSSIDSSVLAKIHMVTKLSYSVFFGKFGSVLAKIHMVTKLVAK